MNQFNCKTKEKIYQLNNKKNSIDYRRYNTLELIVKNQNTLLKSMVHVRNKQANKITLIFAFILLFSHCRRRKCVN